MKLWAPSPPGARDRDFAYLSEGWSLGFAGPIAREQLAKADRASTDRRSQHISTRSVAVASQGGDCAESFEQFAADRIRDSFRVMLQMSVVMMFGGGVPIVKVQSCHSSATLRCPLQAPADCSCAFHISQDGRCFGLQPSNERPTFVQVGRMAGQFAKPRSGDFETVDGVSLPSYRGDIINDAAFTSEARTPDPNR